MKDNFCAQLPDFCAEREAFLTGARSPVDLLEECIRHIENSEETVQAFAHLNIEGAYRLAEESSQRYQKGTSLSPIDGLPIGVKDIIDTIDMPTQMNNKFFAGHRPRADAACVRAVREGGAVILGKTVTTEFAIGRSGPTSNPHNPKHTPGGSSSGTAAGTASGMFAAGFGTQTQGSIIRPASFNGVVGFKPTLGALSTDGVHSLSRTHDHLGVLGQSVDTVWAMSRWIGEVAPAQDSNGLGGNADCRLTACAPTRVAVVRTKGFDDLDEASLAAFEAKLKDLKNTGITAVEPDEDPVLADLMTRLDRVVDISIRMVAFDMRWPFQSYVEAAPDLMGNRIHDLVQLGKEVTLDEYRILRAEREDLRRRVIELGREYDAFVLPAASGPAPEGFEYTGARTLLLYWSFLGFPAFSLPLMTVGDMPFGLQFAGVGGADHKLAQHAKWLVSLTS
jgi:Asp-tRNA(Asn)/Glu-tRNA(Gln) amidotransferase A subunit family amidase